MNITDQNKCLAEWEQEFLKTGDNSLIPEEDQERVLHEVDVLYEEICTLMRVSKENKIN